MNNRVLKDTLQPCFYGLCLLRIIRTILAMRIKWPSKRILIGKTGPDAAHPHVHANIYIAATCIPILGKPAFLYLRLPFGTTPAPEEYTTTSKAAIFLGNYLLADTSWDAKKLQSPHRHLLHREDCLPASEPLVKTYQIAVNIEAKEASMDILIDDIITITIDNPCWVDRAKNSALLIIHTIFRPRKYDKPMKQDDPL